MCDNKWEKEFVKELLVELQKAKPDDVDSEETLSFIEDILRYFDDEDSEKCESNQGLLGIRETFRGHAVQA